MNQIGSQKLNLFQRVGAVLLNSKVSESPLCRIPVPSRGDLLLIGLEHK